MLSGLANTTFSKLTNILLKPAQGRALVIFAMRLARLTFHSKNGHTYIQELVMNGLPMYEWNQTFNVWMKSAIKQTTKKKRSWRDCQVMTRHFLTDSAWLCLSFSLRHRHIPSDLSYSSLPRGATRISLEYSCIWECQELNLAVFSQALLRCSLFGAKSITKNKTWFLFTAGLELLIHLMCL